jgi:hypothetical protein
MNYFKPGELIEITLDAFQTTARQAGQLYKLETHADKLPFIFVLSCDESSFFAYDNERELWLNHTAEGLLESASLDQQTAVELVESVTYPKRVTLTAEFELSFEATSEAHAYEYAQEVLTAIENDNNFSDQDFTISEWEFDKS